MPLNLYAAAPLQYRGLLIYVSIDGESMHANVPEKQLRAATWPELRVLIDEELK